MLVAEDCTVAVRIPPGRKAGSKLWRDPRSWGRERYVGFPAAARLDSSGGFSYDSEHDLALMVSDFWENGSSGAESRYSSDSDSGLNDLGQLSERILFFKHAMDQHEIDLSSAVHSALVSILEKDLHSSKDGQCNASCIRKLLVKHLRIAGYDAAICTSKWQGFACAGGSVPGGDHEYIDVVLKRDSDCGRLIVDIDFRCHFEIARAVKSYDAMLASLPVVYVGSLARLKQFLQVMVEAAKSSLEQNSMPLPPWRSLAYLQAKWGTNNERNDGLEGSNFYESSEHVQCIGHLRRLKASLQSEAETERLFRPITNEKMRRAKFERLWSSLCNS